MTIFQLKNSYRGLKRNSILRGGGTNSLSLSSLPTSHLELSLDSLPTMAAKRLNLPPVLSLVTSFTLSNAPLSTPTGWWHHPSSLRSSLARDNDDGSDVHCYSCHRIVVVLVVMLVDVLLLSVVPSRCCCHRRRCHRQTTNAQRPSSSPQPPPSPLPSQSHWLQLSPPPSLRCQFHCRHRHSYCPRCCIDDANSLNAAVTGCCHHRGHHHHCCHCLCIGCSHRCCNCPCFSVTIATASTDVSAGARSASPDAWACSDNSPSRRGTLELKAW